VAQEIQETTIPEDTRDAEYSAILAGFNVAARILAVRFFLFLSLVGSFVLSIIATNNQSNLSVWIIGVFAAVTTLPLTVLEVRGKRGG
jgi:hypothetical protein